MIVLAPDIYKIPPVDRIQFAPTGLLLAVGHGGFWVAVWDAEVQQLVRGFCHDNSCAAGFRFYSAGERLFYRAAFGEVMWFDPSAPEPGILCRNTGLAEDLLMTRDETHLLVVERGYGEFRLFDLTGGPNAPPVWTKPINMSLPRPARTHIELLPDETRFAVVENHKNKRTRLVVRSMATGEMVDSVKLPYQTAAGLAVSPDGAAVAVANGFALRVYNPEKLRETPRCSSRANTKHLTGVAYHPSGQYIAVTSNDATVRLYDAASLREVNTFSWDIGKLRAIAFSPDGTRAAAGSDTGQVVVWDLDV